MVEEKAFKKYRHRKIASDSVEQDHQLIGS